MCVCCQAILTLPWLWGLLGCGGVWGAEVCEVLRAGSRPIPVPLPHGMLLDPQPRAWGGEGQGREGCACLPPCFHAARAACLQRSGSSQPVTFLFCFGE